MKIYDHTKRYIRPLIAASCIAAQNGKQPKCPSTDDWVNKIVLSLYIGILLSNKKEWIIDTYSKKDDSLSIILSERHQTQMAIYSIIPCI